jgi:hypothetical protein
MDDDDRALFERSVGHACETLSGGALDVALDELGWHEALAVDPRTAVSVLFEGQGRANTTSSALEAVLGSGLGVKAGTSAGVVLPVLEHRRPPGEVARSGRLVVHGLGTASLSVRDTTSVVARLDGGERVLTVKTADLTLRSQSGVDPSLGLVEVIGDDIPFHFERELEPGGWWSTLARAQLAVSHELVGAARTMLALAREHALERIQFGRPIGQFQAVRHRLADTLVAIETADAGVGYAWTEPSPHTVAMAKALAGRSARTASRHCQQVLAGIGFTAEHPFHRYFRRVLVLDQLLGAGPALTKELGSELLATRRLPALPLL